MTRKRTVDASSEVTSPKKKRLRAFKGGAQRGPKPVSEPEKYRSLVWYLAVKARRSWSDYKFSYLLGGPVPLSQGEAPLRKRVFEGIRNGATSLRGDDSMPDLVGRVDSYRDPGAVSDASAFPFRGTAAIYNSPLWEILKAELSDDARYARSLVDSCFEAFGLTRTDESLPPLQNQQAGPLRLLGSRPPDDYCRRLAAVCRRLHPLDSVALVLALIYEAYAVGNWFLLHGLYIGVLKFESTRIQKCAPPLHETISVQYCRWPRAKSKRGPDDDFFNSQTSADSGVGSELEWLTSYELPLPPISPKDRKARVLARHVFQKMEELIGVQALKWVQVPLAAMRARQVAAILEARRAITFADEVAAPGPQVPGHRPTLASAMDDISELAIAAQQAPLRYKESDLRPYIQMQKSLAGTEGAWVPEWWSP